MKIMVWGGGGRERERERERYGHQVLCPTLADENLFTSVVGGNNSGLKC